MLSTLYGKPDIKAEKNPDLYFRAVVLVTYIQNACLSLLFRICFSN